MMMTKMKKSLLAITLGSVLVSGVALADESLGAQTRSAADSAGKKIDSSVDHVGNFMDDSTITAKVKAALIDDDAIKSSDISVKTDKKVVTLSGFVNSQEQAEKAVAVTKGVEGVVSVKDKLHVKDAAGKEQSISGYAGDTATTSEIKAKFLADSEIPSRNLKVTTSNGIVHLSGQVKSQAQAAKAEQIAKAVEGVKSVKNDISIK